MEARIEQEQRENAYRVYLTDALHAIANNTTQFLGMDGIVTNGLQMQERFYDIMHPDKKEKVEIIEKQDTRTSEEFAKDMLRRAMKAR